MALFALPIVASTVAFHFFRPRTTSNYGELVTPPAASLGAVRALGGGSFGFEELRGKWVLVAFDSGACPDACAEKLTSCGRCASRSAAMPPGWSASSSRTTRRPCAPRPWRPIEGTVAHPPPPGHVCCRPSPVNDRAHIYVVDPLGKVMMRFPADADPPRMLGTCSAC